MDLLVFLSFPFLSEETLPALHLPGWSPLPHCLFSHFCPAMCFTQSYSPQHFSALHCITQTLPCRYNGFAQTNNENHITRTSHTLWLLSAKLSNCLFRGLGYQWVNIYESQCFCKTAAWETGRCQPQPGRSLQRAVHCWRWVQTDLLSSFPPLLKHSKVLHV